jgi:hypothetical protein
MKLAIQILIGLAGYLAWAIMAYLDPAQRADFLHFNIGMAVGTIGLVLRDMQPAAPVTPPAPPSLPVPTTVTQS